MSVAHGQMAEGQLEEHMLEFLRGDADVLVCTTIVESGLDIPSANTLIVERADELGLAQLYQIRGRVGRSRERAYAYLLYPSAAALSEEASARLATLSDYTELGSGFKIAMRDLEIRGAGNLLGDEQSGHVAAVGFELYVGMIDEAVRLLAGDSADEAVEPVRMDLPVDAYVPGDYVPYEAAKIEIHRRVAGSREVAQLIVLREELSDRFGPAARDLAADPRPSQPPQGALLPGARHALRVASRAAAAPRRAAYRRARRAAREEPAVVVASAGALAEKVPDPDLRPQGFEIDKGGLLDLDETAAHLVARL